MLRDIDVDDAESVLNAPTNIILDLISLVRVSDSSWWVYDLAYQPGIVRFQGASHRVRDAHEFGTVYIVSCISRVYRKE